MNSQTVQHIIITLLLAFCVFVFAKLLYNKSQPFDVNLHQKITQTMGQLNEIDARWDEDVLKSRLSLNSNYDPLIESMNQLGSLATELKPGYQ